MRTVFAAAALALVAIAAPAAAAVFDLDRARAFCAGGAADQAERCLADQERAGVWIDRFLYSGSLPRYLAKRAYRDCDARYGPDLRRTRICLQDAEDNRRNGGGGFLRSGVTIGGQR